MLDLVLALANLRRALWRCLPCAAAMLVLGALGCSGERTDSGRPAEAATAAASTLRFPELSAAVRIVTDVHGVPHLHAANLPDLYFAWGYVTARDRLWQLEYSRRSANGDLSEWFGNRALRSDGGAQLFELRRRAADIWARERSDSHVGVPLARFAAGINAYLAACRAGAQPWPEEFQALGKEPGDWRPEDSVILLLGQGVLLDLALPELAEAREIDTHGDAWLAARERFDAEHLYTTIPDSAAARMYGDAARTRSLRGKSGVALPTPVRGARLSGTFGTPLASARLFARARAAVGPWLAATTEERDLGASNVFAVGKRRSASGAPLLANDLHLELATPARLHIVHVTVPDVVDAVGAVVPGLPAIVSGRNQRCAWGITSLAADMLDVYADSLSADGRAAWIGGRWETIREAPFTMSFRLLGLRLPTFGQVRRYTSRGPVLTLDKKRRVVLSVRWTLDDRTIRFSRLIGLERSRTAAEVAERYRTLVTPGLNVVAADAGGDVIYQTVGALPRRGFVPPRGTLPGDGRHEWLGAIEPEAMPSWRPPASGFVVNANNLPIGSAYPEPLPRFDWSHDRAIRMADRLAADPVVTLQGMARIQNDIHSLRGERLVPLLLRCADSLASSLSVRERAALDIVRRWDFAARRDQVGATLYNAWLGAFERRSRVRGHLGLVAAALDGRAPDVLHDPSRGSPERPAFAAVMALRLALAELEKQLGPDMTAWTWERAHRAQFSHALEWKRAGLAPTPVGADGDGGTPSAGRSRLPDHTLMSHGPVVRHVVDLANADSSLGVIPPGNSGVRTSRHARDQLDLWANHGYVPFYLSWERIEAMRESEMRLEPAKR